MAHQTSAACGAAQAFAFGPDPTRLAVGSHGQPGISRAPLRSGHGAAPFVPLLMPHGGAPRSVADFMGAGAFSTSLPPCAERLVDPPEVAQVRQRFRDASVATIQELQRTARQWPVLAVDTAGRVVEGQTGLDFVRLLDTHLRENRTLQRLWMVDANEGVSICDPGSALRTSMSHAIVTSGFAAAFGIDAVQLQQIEQTLGLLLSRINALFRDIHFLRTREMTGAEGSVPLGKAAIAHILERNGIDSNEGAAEHFARHTIRAD